MQPDLQDLLEHRVPLDLLEAVALPVQLDLQVAQVAQEQWDLLDQLEQLAAPEPPGLQDHLATRVQAAQVGQQVQPELLVYPVQREPPVLLEAAGRRERLEIRVRLDQAVHPEQLDRLEPVELLERLV